MRSERRADRPLGAETVGLNGVVVRKWLATLLFVSGALLGESVHAQSNGAVFVDPRVGLPSDTGRLTRGYIDFSRYAGPRACLQSGLSVQRFMHRGNTPDTTSYEFRLRDTLPTIARDIVANCLQRFRVEQLRADELQSMTRGALLTGRDSLIGAVIAHRFRSAHTIGDSALVMGGVIDAYMSAIPARVDSADVMLTRLDALGAAGRIAQLHAHVRLLGHWRSVFDRVRMQRSASAIVHLYSVLTPHERDDYSDALAQGYWTLLDLVVFDLATDRSADSVKAESAHVRLKELIAQTERELLTLRRGEGKLQQGGVLKYVTLVNAMGMPMPPFEASRWFPDVGSSSPTDPPRTDIQRTVQPERGPERGVVSLICTVNQNGGIQLYPTYSLLRRLHAKYAARGLRIIVTQRTVGYTDWNISGPLTEAEEAEFARWYFGEYLKLPATLAVHATVFGKTADGRRVSQAPSSLLSSPMIGTKLVDRTGALRYVAIGMPGEKELEAYIESALAR